MNDPRSERLTLTQVAKLVKVHVATVWRWAGTSGVRGRRLKTVMVGGRRFVPVTELERFLEFDVNAIRSPKNQRAEIAERLLDSKGIIGK